MKTVHGLLHQAVDFMTAAIGWIEMDDKRKAIAQIKLAVGVITEIGERLKTMIADLETEQQPENKKE